MILGIDIGNTTIEFGFIDENIKSFKLSTNQEKTADDWLIDIHNLHKLANINPQSIKDSVISSVVPKVTQSLSKALYRFYGKKTIILKDEVKIPIVNKYKHPEEVGTDRLVNAFSALQITNPPIVVIDLGTAVTFDVINEKGEYEGGLIFLGIEKTKDCLFSKTAKLPMTNFKKPEHIIGKTTEESIQSGLYYGFKSMLEGIVSQIYNSFESEPNIVLTGGNANIFYKDLNFKCVIEPDLTMKGIQNIYKTVEKNKNNL